MSLYVTFLVSGLALGGAYALSGVGIVILFRATGVLNLAYGAMGALGALIAWNITDLGAPEWAAYLACVASVAAASLAYGAAFGPLLADRDQLTKAIATLGYGLVLLGVMFWVWHDDPRSLTLPTSRYGFNLGDVRVNATQLASLGLALAVTAATSLFLRRSGLGTAMRALADDRRASAVLGVRVRRVEALAWLGSGLVCGVTALLLANLVRLDASTLTFLVVASLAAAVIGRLRSIWATLAAGVGIGVVESVATPVDVIAPYRSMIPFVAAILVLLWLGRHRRVAVTHQGRAG